MPDNRRIPKMPQPIAAMIKPFALSRLARSASGLAMLAIAGGCASGLPQGDGAEVSASDWARVSSQGVAGSAWVHQTFPGKRASRYVPLRKDGREAVLVRAESSASILRRKVRVEPAALGRLQFSWLVPAMIESADLAQRDADDSPVRLVLAFDGDRSKFSPKDAMLSELAETLTGEAMPYATLMYVWSNRGHAESVIVNPRTGRIRKLVLEAGPGKLSQWLSYERDLQADFIKAFGEPPGALLSIGIMTDTDNTRSQASAWYGPVRHLIAE